MIDFGSSRRSRSGCFAPLIDPVTATKGRGYTCNVCACGEVLSLNLCCQRTAVQLQSSI